jgi:hypothetical protein
MDTALLLFAFIDGLTLAAVAALYVYGPRALPRPAMQPAALPTTPDGATASETLARAALIAAIKRAGHEVTRETDDGCHAMVEGIRLLFSIDAGRHYVGAIARWQADGTTFEAINRFNRKTLLARAWLDDEGANILEIDSACAAANPDAQLDAFLRRIPPVLAQFCRETATGQPSAARH